jgi:hypothetical protein
VAKAVNIPASNKRARWEDLTQSYLSCCNALSMVTPISNLLLSLNESKVPSSDLNVIKTLARQMTQDISSYSEAMKTIHAKHTGRSGIINVTTELFECIELGENYQMWLSSFETVVLPVSKDLLERIAKYVNAEEIPANV